MKIFDPINYEWSDMNLLCIDPGTEVSGVVIYNGDIVDYIWPEMDNNRLVAVLPHIQADHMAIEMVANMGMPAGKSLFETCVWIGRFIEAFPGEHTKIFRRDVKLALCDSMRAKDGNIRQAIIDRFPATGGGKTPQIGIKKQPGLLYGMSKHAWSALAVGITYFEMNREVDNAFAV